MKNVFFDRGALMVFLFLFSMELEAQPIEMTRFPVYEGNDLGLSYSKDSSSFRVWAPTAEKVQLSLYKDALGGSAPIERLAMEPSVSGTWHKVLKGDHEGVFYTFRVMSGGVWLNEVPDPYVKLVGVNGRRGYVGALDKAVPGGWQEERSPEFAKATDAVIYELHVRDASIHASSGITQKGRFTGLTQTGTRNNGGAATGIDHIADLGVTHVHLLPSYDFYSVDETRPEHPQYNWGYDPLNYNVPEGSYSTNAGDPYARVREFRELVMALHRKGIRVVMDVVYNHTMLTEDSWFNQLVPGYYYRQKEDGSFSDATACGNETASERPMMRKFILESVKHWVKEYHIDGFRFDLMGVHDIETMNLVAAELRKIKPDILLYGEGWTAGASPLPEDLRALKKNASQLGDIAVFSDDIRDGIKGSVFEHSDKGFVSGKPGMEESVKFGIVAATEHPQVDYSRVNYSKRPYANAASQVVTYCECHDNHVLWDKLAISRPDANEAVRKDMHKLALTIVLTSQGISFLHAGTEFLRSKQGVENSFDSPDSINAIDWELKSANGDVYDYIKALVMMRRSHPAFRMTGREEISANIRFLESAHGLIRYTINGAAAGDSWKEIFIAFNGSDSVRKLIVPGGSWRPFVVNNAKARSRKVPAKIAPHSAIIMYKP